MTGRINGKKDRKGFLSKLDNAIDHFEDSSYDHVISISHNDDGDRRPPNSFPTNRALPAHCFGVETIRLSFGEPWRREGRLSNFGDTSRLAREKPNEYNACYR